MAITYEPLATTTLSSATNTVTFSSISGAYTDLVLIANVRKGGDVGEPMFVRFNSDTGSNYSFTWLVGIAGGPNSYRASNQTMIQIYGQTTTASVFTANILNIQDYSNSTTYKTVISRTNSGNREVNSTVGLWRSTSAITSITLTPDAYLSPNFEIGCSFTLYGIKEA